jgi:chemotaxis protein methyltransferase CheR
MLLDYYAKENGRQFTYEIDAFDINAEAIKTAKSGRYTVNTLRSDGAEWKYILDSYLAPDGNEYVVSHNIRNKIRFFTHNVMDGFDRQYDIIFFRNALIYFSPESRWAIMDDIAEALFNDGVLFLGTTETSSVSHPLLLNRYMSGVFYFQKIPAVRLSEVSRPLPDGPLPDAKPPNSPLPPAPKSPALSVREAPPRQKSAELKIDCKEVAALLDDQEGIPVMRKVLETVKNETGPREALSGSELAAGLIGFLGSQDFDSALPVLTYLENRGSAAFIDFLRGEYNYLCGKAEEAEKKFEDAAGKDRSFWPAFYRICSLAAGGNRTRYEYKIKKALESLTLGKDFHYECFIGGFSPDYFRRILEKKLTD